MSAASPAWEDVTPEFEPVRPDFTREGRWGRPIIVQPDGSKATYTRATTFVSAPEDLYNVNRWKLRKAALGLSERPDLRLAIAAQQEDRGETDKIIEEALEAGGANTAARIGTNLHRLTEYVDTGRKLPVVEAGFRTALDAYAEAMRPFKIGRVEEHLVQDRLKVAGTADRILTFKGQRYIADLKTGSSIDLGTGKIAGQLAMYAHSRPYDVTTDERTDAHGCSTTWGLIIHLPAERPGECTLHWVDLEAGWRWVEVARQVREQRAISFSAWRKDFDPDHRPDPTVSEIRTAAKRQVEERVLDTERRKLARMIDATDSVDLLRGLWRDHAGVWTEDLTQRAKQRISELGSDDA